MREILINSASSHGLLGWSGEHYRSFSTSQGLALVHINSHLKRLPGQGGRSFHLKSPAKWLLTTTQEQLLYYPHRWHSSFGIKDWIWRNLSLCNDNSTTTRYFFSPHWLVLGKEDRNSSVLYWDLRCPCKLTSNYPYITNLATVHYWTNIRSVDFYTNKMLYGATCENEREVAGCLTSPGTWTIFLMV